MYYKMSQILVVFLLICQHSVARLLANENIVLVTAYQFPISSKSSYDQTHIDKEKMKARRERVNLLLHRLPKGKKPVSGPSKRTNSLND